MTNRTAELAQYLRNALADNDPRRPYAGVPRAVVAEVAALLDTPWRPINSAPKDGTRLDLWVEDGREADATWAEPKLSSLGPCWCRWAYDECFGWINQAIGGTPTHWQPLPPAP